MPRSPGVYHLREHVGWLENETWVPPPWISAALMNSPTEFSVFGYEQGSSRGGR